MLTISIINYRNSRATSRFVSELIGACRSIECQILVRDNSETSEIEDMKAAIGSSEIPIHFAASPHNPGFGAGHNLNFKLRDHADGDSFLILNNDLHLDDLNAVVKLAENASPGRIVSCKIRSNRDGGVWFSGGTFSSVTGNLKVHRDDFEGARRSTQFISGCCLLIPAGLFRDLGGFDERFFMYAEDMDLSIRAQRLGTELVILAQSMCHDVGSGEKGRYSDLYLYENTKNRIICMRKLHLGLPVLRDIWFIAKFGVARSLQLLFFSHRSSKQILISWRGVLDGYRARI